MSATPRTDRPASVTPLSGAGGGSTPAGDVAGAAAEDLLLLFAPMHKHAFGVATGTAGALLMAAVTLAALLLPGARGFPLHLLGEYLAGYDVTWPGVAVGAAWGFVVAYVAGWFTAFARNLTLAGGAFLIRARAELVQTRDFLDHI
jgi:hypothetical protein